MAPIFYILILTVFSIFCRETVQAQKTTNCNCGRNDHIFRIVGGKIAKPNSFPWMAALNYNSLRIIFCGGALINDRYVITSGHCASKIQFPQQGSVILGMHDTSRREEGLEIGLKYVLLHENFVEKGGGDINDIALLKLNRVVKFTNKIKPVCLPTYPVRDYAGKIAQVAGWGKTKYNSQQNSKLLRETSLQVLSQQQCKKHRIIGRFLLDSMLCAYQDKTDTCDGDSGGPLTYETSSGKNELIGVVSWGIECAKPDTPGVYTRVTSYIDWIARNTRDAVYCRN